MCPLSHTNSNNIENIRLAIKSRLGKGSYDEEKSIPLFLSILRRDNDTEAFDLFYRYGENQKIIQQRARTTGYKHEFINAQVWYNICDPRINTKLTPADAYLLLILQTKWAIDNDIMIFKDGTVHNENGKHQRFHNECRNLAKSTSSAKEYIFTLLSICKENLFTDTYKACLIILGKALE